MGCENEFCIYYENGNCILQNIQLDRNGMCMDCILIKLDEVFLKNERKQLLEKLNQQRNL